MSERQDRYRESNVMVGDLPSDFLSLDSQGQGQGQNQASRPPISNNYPQDGASAPPASPPAAAQRTAPMSDEELARNLQEEENRAAAASRRMQPVYAHYPTTLVNRLRITVLQAKLAKNYGLLRMDPYCRVRLANVVLETRVANSGGKNPVWNDMLSAVLPPGVDSLLIELYDETTFSRDERIAWAHVLIPEDVLNGRTSDQWYDLNGKQGDGKEGSINIVLKLEQQQVPVYPPPMSPYGYVAPMQFGMPPASIRISTLPGPVSVPPGPPNYALPGPAPGAAVAAPQDPPAMAREITDEDVARVAEMFPEMSRGDVRAVLVAKRGNAEMAINELLQMSNSTSLPVANTTNNAQC